ncbi:hypothetical protein MRX96_053577 [Rhipicephalus microplus]
MEAGFFLPNTALKQERCTVMVAMLPLALRCLVPSAGPQANNRLPGFVLALPLPAVPCHLLPPALNVSFSSRAVSSSPPERASLCSPILPICWRYDIVIRPYRNRQCHVTYSIYRAERYLGILGCHNLRVKQANTSRPIPPGIGATSASSKVTTHQLHDIVLDDAPKTSLCTSCAKNECHLTSTTSHASLATSVITDTSVRLQSNSTK